MPLNLGYAGLGKETTPGTGVAPTFFFRLQEVPQVRAAASFAEVPALDALGVSIVVPTQRHAEADLSVVVTPRAIGALLAALLGAPTTTGAAPNYTHTFTPKTSYPSYTLEVQDGVAVHRAVGAQVAELTLRHAADGYLQAQATLVGMDRTTTGTAATPTYESQVFNVGQVSVSIGGSAVTGRASQVEVSISVPKTPFNALSQVPAVAVYPEGTAEVTASMELVFDSTEDAGRLTDFLAATARSVSLAWTIDANTSLTVAFDGYLTEDPWVASNRDTGMARIRLALKAVRTGSNLLTVTLKNSQASY
uniref:Uncharacterized protein n=1 Tax=Thermus caliditerrae TaxID=1330700 RepID=A0A7C5REE4_9DEIN